METLKWLAHYRLLGYPLWAWLIACAPVVSEAINRSKWTKAQTIWQFCWRLVAATPLGAIPGVGRVLRVMAIPGTERNAIPPSVLLLLVVPFVGSCATLEQALYKSVQSTAQAGITCYEVVNSIDQSRHRQITEQMKTDPDAARAAEDDWDNKCDAALKICRSARAGAAIAQAQIPVILAAKDKDTQAAAWIARLGRMVSQVGDALKIIGLGD